MFNLYVRGRVAFVAFLLVIFSFSQKGFCPPRPAPKVDPTGILTLFHQNLLEGGNTTTLISTNPADLMETASAIRWTLSDVFVFLGFGDTARFADADGARSAVELSIGEMAPESLLVSPARLSGLGLLVSEVVRRMAVQGKLPDGLVRAGVTTIEEVALHLESVRSGGEPILDTSVDILLVKTTAARAPGAPPIVRTGIEAASHDHNVRFVVVGGGPKTLQNITYALVGAVDTDRAMEFHLFPNGTEGWDAARVLPELFTGSRRPANVRFVSTAGAEPVADLSEAEAVVRQTVSNELRVGRPEGSKIPGYLATLAKSLGVGPSVATRAPKPNPTSAASARSSKRPALTEVPPSDPSLPTDGDVFTEAVDKSVDVNKIASFYHIDPKDITEAERKALAGKSKTEVYAYFKAKAATTRAKPKGK